MTLLSSAIDYQMMNQEWSSKTAQEVFEKLDSSDQGLTQEEASERLKKYGPNKLPEAKAESFFIIFLRQFQSPLIYILFGASIIIFSIGEVIDGSIILGVLLFNSIIGSLQEGKAQNTLLALKQFTETHATVFRNGKESIIPDTQLVPGDLITLQEGEKVPADSRIITAANLQMDEASLTGESGAVPKTSAVLKKISLPITEQKNMLFKGTHLVAGNSKAVVVATGVQSAIGKIFQQISTIDNEVPLKASIRALSQLIVTIVACITVFLFLLGILSGKSVSEMFTTVVSLAVAIIPEGLPIVMTLVLATGVRRMSKRHALVKKLQAVEALGQANVIAVDKTGTITKNEMVVRKIYVNNHLFKIDGIGYEPHGAIRLQEKIINPAHYPELLAAGKIGALSANATLSFLEAEKLRHVSGDPTEAAMLVLAEKLGFSKEALQHKAPRLDEIPFDYQLKYHATIHEENHQKLLIVAGAPEVIIHLSKNIKCDQIIHSLSEKEQQHLESVILNMSKEGLRVIALAESHQVPDMFQPESINNLTLVALLGIKDALRLEVAEAIKKVSSTGIRVVMITGDHQVTAQAIAQEAGIYQRGDTILTGKEIDTFSEEELSLKLSKISVFARVTPEHKLRIIKAYQACGKTIAMTGDGVNDAPSLVAADLGVAMGCIGTEVAKEASDIVLLDDNFGSILAAVEEGRSIYKTIKKVILYLFSTNWGEMLTMIGALLLGYPMPLLPAQIIWLNFVTDTFLDMALAMEPKEEGLLYEKRQRPKKYIIDQLMVQRMVIMSLPMMLGTLFLFRKYFEYDLTKAWTISLTTLAVFQWFNAFNCRHESTSIFKTSFFSNKFLIAAILIVIALQLAVIYHPWLQHLMHTTSLSLSEWFMIISVATSIIITEEIRKFFYRRTAH